MPQPTAEHVRGYVCTYISGRLLNWTQGIVIERGREGKRRRREKEEEEEKEEWLVGLPVSRVPRLDEERVVIATKRRITR